MSTLEQLYAKADERRAQGSLNYGGALLPAEAFELLQLDPSARLVDVRTRAELDWIGRPLVGDGQYLHLEWTRYPGGVPNPAFIDELKAAVAPDAPILFLCRSAARSKLAAVAAAQAGFTKAFDLLEGFEGAKDAEGHRKMVEGWCFRKLPWIGA
ncbi:rhodanese-like domain-containing protein [Burkholderia stagnalis]